MIEIKHCIICGTALTEKQIKRGTKTCCRSCASKILWTKEYKEQFSNKLKKFYSDESNRKMISDKVKAAFKKEEVKQKHKKAMESIETKLKLSNASKQNWQNSEYRQKNIQNSQIARSSKEYKQKCSEIAKNLWKTKSYKQKQIESHSSHSKAMWQDENFKKRHANAMKLAQSKQSYKQALSSSLKRTYAERNPEIQQKRYETMKKNNSFAKSTAEDKSYQLLKTKCLDTIRQYLDKDRYPFKVDFYVPSLDLFIECHYSEFHQYEPFDPTNEEHLERLKCLQSKADEKLKQTGKESKYHKMIYTWTDLDVRKRQCAIDNKLNWLCFYAYGDFERWINEDKI